MYDWDRMSRDSYAWWSARVQHMSRYFSALRLNHILGFLRVWELPAQAVTGLSGHYEPSNPVSGADLDARGLWDRDRLSRPYLRPHLLQRRFGKDWCVVAERFLYEKADTTFAFRPGFDTESALAQALEEEPVVLDGFAQSEVLQALLDCVNDKCLVRDEARDDCFYPRSCQSRE